MKRTHPGTVLGSLAIAAFLLPLHFLLCLGSWASESGLWVFPAAILGGILTAGAVRSKTLPQAFARLLLSAPVTVLYWKFQADFQLHDRALNWVIPGYGTSSAGGNFAGGFLLLFIAGCAGLGGLLGILITQEQSRPNFWNAVQKTAFAAGGCIWAAVIVLSCIMPPIAASG